MIRRDTEYALDMPDLSWPWAFLIAVVVVCLAQIVCVRLYVRNRYSEEPE